MVQVHNILISIVLNCNLYCNCTVNASQKISFAVEKCGTDLGPAGGPWKRANWKSFLGKEPCSNFTCVCVCDWFPLTPCSLQDLSSPNQYDTGVALTGLSCFVTPDLARDLANDIMTLVRLFDYKIIFKNASLVHKYCSSLWKVRVFEYTAVLFMHLWWFHRKFGFCTFSSDPS